jgi:hypothetical protein
MLRKPLHSGPALMEFVFSFSYINKIMRYDDNPNLSRGDAELLAFDFQPLPGTVLTAYRKIPDTSPVTTSSLTDSKSSSRSISRTAL